MSYLCLVKVLQLKEGNTSSEQAFCVVRIFLEHFSSILHSFAIFLIPQVGHSSIQSTHIQ
jgi:hypothetical protein